MWVDKLKLPTTNDIETRKDEKSNEYDEIFYNEFRANPPEQPRTWELENTGIMPPLFVFVCAFMLLYRQSILA